MAEKMDNKVTPAPGVPSEEGKIEKETASEAKDTQVVEAEIVKEEPKVDANEDTSKAKTEEATKIDTKEGTSEKKVEASTPEIAKVPAVKDSKVNDSPIELEREYIVPLKRGSLKVPRYKRAKKAVKTLKEFLAKHMKVNMGIRCGWMV